MHHHTRGLAASAALVLAAGSARADEGGTGHYLPGSLASFVDAVPAKPTVIVRANVFYYTGSIGVDLPIAGLDVANVNATIWGYGLTLAWRPPLELGHGLSYAMSATLPVLSVDVSGQVALAGGGSVARSDSRTALGDLIVQPIMLMYPFSDDFSTNARVGIYAPTGSFEVGRLANTSKNFWTVEPILSFIYFGKHNGIEAAVFGGLDFNSTNQDTDYHSGAAAHVDGTLALHLPLLGGLTGIGGTGFWYRQIEGDSGTGAKLGPFEGRTMAVGPVASYVVKLGSVPLTAELKWLHEFDTQRRLEGDLVFLKALLSL